MEQNRFNCAAFPLQHITNTDEVVQFATYLVKDLSVRFHPDETFDQYINLATHEPSFTAEECATADALMSECFDVCEREGVDIYDTMCDVYDILGY